ncbi:hypothetical protein NPS70_27945 [Streptomyces sp. C10-9-1]|uniref:hypothetical protein n=1 Tax=Streptomyces sp. C10-9-1 TaxID=1859285 RepID=UPI0021136AB4|nr:hypothetical protein [Streptomyces sp. C10-9-1]MCQ6556989.1 hypothetical protein [Streptomyces sp. C10-9-1]
MPDERDEWLDRDAAESLLRGDPVDATDQHARARAARLQAVLRGAAEPAYAGEEGELPGEAVALAAFRKARADAAPAGSLLGTVKVAAPSPAPRRPRFGRPLRYGLAAALAGCALGGVAVAASTGVLPTPFHDDAPLPAASVSAAATPEVLVSRTPDGSPGAEAPTSPGAVAPPPARPSTGAPEGSGAPGEGGAPAPAVTAPPPAEAPEEASRTPEGDKEAALRRKAVEACEEHRAGGIPADRRARLEALSGGADRVERFCDRLLGPAEGDEGDDGDGPGEDDGDGGSSGGRAEDGSRQGGAAPVPRADGAPPPVPLSALTSAVPRPGATVLHGVPDGAAALL